VTYRDGFIYVSSSTTVYRWPYVAGSRRLVTEPPTTIITNLPTGGHGSDGHTLIFDSQGRLYINIGSLANVDSNSDRSRIVRVNLNQQFPIVYPTGTELFADGVRNECGLDFDRNGILWGVENGADNLNRPDLGGDIHNGNPSEEMNKFDKAPGQHYGYPYCFSTHNLPGTPAGTQFAWPSFMNDGVHTDEWCRNTANNQGPAFPMPAHVAPLGIQFYKSCTGAGAFPCTAVSDAFVAMHGSWNSDVKVGYKVVQYVFDKTTLMPTGETLDILFDQNLENPGLRPVNVVFDRDGHMIVTSDSSNDIIRVYHAQQPPTLREGCPAEKLF